MYIVSAYICGHEQLDLPLLFFSIVFGELVLTVVTFDVSRICLCGRYILFNLTIGMTLTLVSLICEKK
jgi:hypothetical protein